MHCFRGEDVGDCGLVPLQMLLVSHIYLVCHSCCGSQSNLLHRSDGFIEVSGKSKLKNRHCESQCRKNTLWTEIGFDSLWGKNRFDTGFLSGDSPLQKL